MPGCDRDTAVEGPESEHSVYIGVGANLGDRMAACRAGIHAIAACGGGRIVALSRFYHTAPQDYLEQEWFVNAVAAVKTRLNPLRLLHLLKTIEAEMGRSGKGPRYGPRPIDLDILLYDDLVMDAGSLVVPHPRLHKRRFVLQPLCDIAPDIRHPLLHQTMLALLARDEISLQPVELLEIGNWKL